jgi:steroid delta-isomerase-like uncharacterized protein
MSAANKALARRLLEEAFNAGNVAVMDEILAEVFVNYDAALPEPGVGIEAAKASVTGYRDAFPDLKITIEEQIAEGDTVVTRWSARGTHQGDLMGIPPTGKQATVTGITIDTIAGGKITESRTNWDTLGLMQQIGVVPALATA